MPLQSDGSKPGTSSPKPEPMVEQAPTASSDFGSLLNGKTGPEPDAEHVRNTGKLLEILKRVKALKENAEDLLRNLPAKPGITLERKAISLETAHKMLTDLQFAYLNYHTEQAMLIERLRIKGENYSAVNDLFESLQREVDSNLRELSRQIQLCKEYQNNAINPAEQNQHGTQRNAADLKSQIFKLIADLKCKPEPSHIDSVSVKSEGLILTIREQYEKDLKEFNSAREVLRLKKLKLGETAAKLKQDSEQAFKGELKRVLGVLHDCLSNYNEVLSSRNHYKALQTETLNLNWDFGLPKTDNPENEKAVTILQRLMPLLESTNISEKYRKKITVEIGFFADNIANLILDEPEGSNPNPAREAESQTSINGSSLSGAIKVHADNLKQKRKRKD